MDFRESELVVMALILTGRCARLKHPHLPRSVQAFQGRGRSHQGRTVVARLWRRVSRTIPATKTRTGAGENEGRDGRQKCEEHERRDLKPQENRGGQCHHRRERSGQFPT